MARKRGDIVLENMRIERLCHRTISEITNPLFDKMRAIESAIQAHALGVQNVYNELQVLKNKLDEKTVLKLIRTLQKYDIEALKKHLANIQEWTQANGI